MSTTTGLETMFEMATDYLQRLRKNPALPAALEFSAHGVRLRVSLETATGVPALRVPNPKPAKQVEEDIITVLSLTGHRLVTDQVLSELAKRKLLHGDSTVKMALARMTKPEDGRLTQDPNDNPRGYGLPEWDMPLAPAQQGQAEPARQTISPISKRPSIAAYQPSVNGHSND